MFELEMAVLQFPLNFCVCYKILGESTENPWSELKIDRNEYVEAYTPYFCMCVLYYVCVCGRHRPRQQIELKSFVQNLLRLSVLEMSLANLAMSFQLLSFEPLNFGLLIKPILHRFSHGKSSMKIFKALIDSILLLYDEWVIRANNIISISPFPSSVEAIYLCPL